MKRNDLWWDKTWNPITGCSPVSEGCEHCWAKRMANRLRGRYGYPQDEPFRVTFHPDRLDEPLKWKKPCRIFVCSMGDLFHSEVKDRAIDNVFARAIDNPQHIFIILTKRPERMLSYLCDPAPQIEVNFNTSQRIWHIWATCKRETPYLWHSSKDEVCGPWPLPNVWLGVSCENQARADERIPILLQIPAAKRFVSIEPMLGPVDLQQAHGLYYDLEKNKIYNWAK